MTETESEPLRERRRRCSGSYDIPWWSDKRSNPRWSVSAALTLVAIFGISCGRSTATGAAAGSGGATVEAGTGSGGLAREAGAAGASNGGSSGTTGGAGGGGASAGGAPNAQCPWADLDVDLDNCGSCSKVCPRLLSPGDFAGKVMKVPRDGGSAITLALVRSSGSKTIAIDDTSVYWDEYFEGGSVMAVPVAGGETTTVAGTGNGVYFLTVDATNLYWSNLGGDVMQRALGGGTPMVLRSSPEAVRVPSDARAIALDATYVYFAASDNTVQKVPIGGGPAITLATVESHPPYPASPPVQARLSGR